MTKCIKLKNPPITEAIIDIRVNLMPEIDLTVLSTFHENIKDLFPQKKERKSWEGSIQLKENGNADVVSKKTGIDGYLFKSSDEKKIVQARLDGFTFNKLKPYESWEEISTEAKNLWKHYIEIAKPINVTRLALRYINRIEIPIPLNDFKDYILTIPEIAPEIPQGPYKFFMQLYIPDTKTSSIAIVTETIEEFNVTGKSLPFIFDIDVFQQISLLPNSNEIWNMLETLRKFKNTIFFKSITNKTLELFT